MNRSRVLAWAAAAAVIGASAALAHVRLHNPSNGNPLFWGAPGAISIVINSTGSDDIPDGSHEPSIRNSIRSWNDLSGTSMTLVEDSSPASQARTDWASTGVHLVYFDEANTSGFFPGSSGIVAITPVWFFSSGSITDADILFNGSQFTFTTDAASSAMDVEDVVTHELGHLLGLDHSGIVGATMYPFVSGNVTAHRSLSADEGNGMRDAYPAGASASLTGTILRLSDSSPVPGAWVVARDANGRTSGADLSDGSGNFDIRGLGAGTYTVYASPLDSPVSAGNLTAGHTIVTDFEPAFYGLSASVGATSTLALGNLFVDADVSVNLGVGGDALPAVAIADGVMRVVTLRGTGLNAGSTLTVSDPAFTVGVTNFFVSQVQFQLTVPLGAAPGHADVAVTQAGTGNLAVLPGAIEIVPPSPTVASILPTNGAAAGGTAVTITGTNFRAGSRVVVGDQLYVDGDVGGATVVDSTTITLTTAATVVGSHDVVVLDSTGVEGRLASSFTVATTPVINSTFPSVGASAGGTEIVLTGSNFLAGLAVRIDGVTQNNVTIESSSMLRITSEAGVPGGPYTLEVQNSGGGLATSAFAYVAAADPELQMVTPTSGEDLGGETLRLVGTGFQVSTQIVFNADPDTGAGGTPAASVTFIDANNLDVETPAHTPGAVTVLARNNSGQADVVAAAFTFESTASGGGGGGCHTEFVAGDPSQRLRDALLGSAWLLLLALYLQMRATVSARRMTRLRVSVH